MIQAGREVRVVVTPDRIDDGGGDAAVGDDRAQDRGRAAVSGTDQGRRDPGDASGGLRSMSARILDGVALGKTIRAEVAAEVAQTRGQRAEARTRGRAGGRGSGERGLRALQGEGDRGGGDVLGDDPPAGDDLRGRAARRSWTGSTPIPKIHGILVQLPLPKHIDSEKVLAPDRPGEGRGRLPPGERRQAGDRRPDGVPPGHALRRAADADPLGDRDQGRQRGDRRPLQHRRQADGEPADPAGPRRRRDGDRLPLADRATCPAVTRARRHPHRGDREGGVRHRRTWCGRARW